MILKTMLDIILLGQSDSENEPKVSEYHGPRVTVLETFQPTWPSFFAG